MKIQVTTFQNYKCFRKKTKLYGLVIWKNLEYNIGNAFDEVKGTFTCPHEGIYSFYATAQVYYSQFGNVYIYVNGSSKVQIYVNTDKSSFDQSSPNGVFKLKKGDTVNIRMNGYFNYANSECFRTYFQGHLIDLL